MQHALCHRLAVAGDYHRSASEGDLQLIAIQTDLVPNPEDTYIIGMGNKGVSHNFFKLKQPSSYPISMRQAQCDKETQRIFPHSLSTRSKAD